MQTLMKFQISSGSSVFAKVPVNEFPVNKGLRGECLLFLYYYIVLDKTKFLRVKV